MMNRCLSLAGAVALVLAFVVFDLTKKTPVHDEAPHGQTVQYFGEMWSGTQPATLDYGNSLGPLFYGFFGVLAALGGGFTVWRLVSLLFALGIVFFLSRLPFLTERERNWLPWMAYLSGSWALLSSFTLHSEAAAAFPLAVVIWCLAEIGKPQKNWKPWLCLGLALASLPLIRVYTIFVFPALFLSFFVAFGLKQKRPFVIVCLAFIPAACLWWHWGGLIPPQFVSGNEAATPALYRTGFGGSTQKVLFTFQSLIRIPSTLTHVGIYMLPWLWYLREPIRREWKPSLVILMFAIGLNLVIPLGCAGALDSVLRKTLHLPNPIPFVSASQMVEGLRLFYAIGTWAFLEAIWLGRQRILAREILPVFCCLCWLFYSLSLPFSGGLFVERYVHPMHVIGVVFGLIISSGYSRSFWPWIPAFLLGFLHTFAKPPHPLLPR